MDFHEQFHTMAHHYYSHLVPSLQAAAGPNRPWPEMTGRTANETERIQRAGPNDVIFGRGSLANNHIGNIRFRQLVKHYQEQYSSAFKSDKPLIALQIVRRLKTMSPPGRFLSKPHAAGVESDYWIEVDEDQATRKVGQRLREKMTSSWEARRRPRREDVSTKTGEFVDAVLSQASTFSHEKAGPNHGASGTTTVPAVTSSHPNIIEPENEDEVHTGAITEDRYPDIMTMSITIRRDEDLGVGFSDIPTAAALLDLLEDF